MRESERPWETEETMEIKQYTHKCVTDSERPWETEESTQTMETKELPTGMNKRQ